MMTIAKDLKRACRKLQMNPKEILKSIKSQGGLSEADCEAQVTAEIEKGLTMIR